MLKYPIPKQKRVALVKLYYEVAVMPGMPASIMAVAAESLNYLTRSKTKLTIEDLRLPWKPIYKLLSKELFLSRRKFEIKSVLPVRSVHICLCSFIVIFKFNAFAANYLLIWGILLNLYGGFFTLQQQMRCWKHFCLTSTVQI